MLGRLKDNPAAPVLFQDPFNAQETKPYRNDPEILAMTKLVDAFNSDNIAEFEQILRDNRRTVMEDGFIRNYIEDLLKTIRTQVPTPLPLPRLLRDVRP